jgi:hypothetical protein
MTDETTTTPALPANPPTVTPNAAAAASARLTGLTSDPKWSERFFAGDVEARREFAELTAAVAAGDDVSAAINGTSTAPPSIETVMNDDLPSRARTQVIDTMRDTGLSDGAIAEAFQGAKVSRQEFQAAKQYQAMRHGDQKLGGAAEAERQAVHAKVIEGKIIEAVP